MRTPQRSIVVRDYRVDPDSPAHKQRTRRVRWWLWPVLALLAMALLYALLWSDWDFAPLDTSTTAATVTSAPAADSSMSALRAGGELLVTPADALDPSEALAWTVATVARGTAAAAPVERNSVASWLAAGASEVLWLTSGDGGLVPSVGVRVVPGLLTELGVPLASSAFKLADGAAKTRTVVFASSDMVLAPSFGRNLQAFLRIAGSQPFLLTAHRVPVVLAPDLVATAVREGEEALRKWLPRGTRPSNPHAFDVFAFPRGVMQTVPFPDFLLGRNIWDLWLWSYATRNWRAVDGGNVMSAFHQENDLKGPQDVREYNLNSQRARQAAAIGQGVTCNRMQCADVFLYRGTCREVGQPNTAIELARQWCMRRKEAGWFPSDAKDDHKTALAALW